MFSDPELLKQLDALRRRRLEFAQMIAANGVDQATIETLKSADEAEQEFLSRVVAAVDTNTDELCKLTAALLSVAPRNADGKFASAHLNAIAAAAAGALT